MLFFSDDIPQKAKRFIATVILLGAATLVYCLYEAFLSTDLTWLIFAGITVLGSFAPVRIPFTKGKSQSITITASDLFIFASILLYSPEVGVCVALIDSCLGSRRIKRVYRIFFNLSQLTLVTLLSGHLFYLLQTQRPLEAAQGVEGALLLFLNFALCAVLYFVLNSGLIAVAISLATQNRMLGIWRENFLWASLTTLASASAATLVFLNFERTQFFSFGIAIPLVIVIYNAHRQRQREAVVRSLGT